MARAVALEEEIGEPAALAAARAPCSRKQLLWAGDLAAARALARGGRTRTSSRSGNERQRPVPPLRPGARRVRRRRPRTAEELVARGHRGGARRREHVRRAAGCSTRSASSRPGSARRDEARATAARLLDGRDASAASRPGIVRGRRRARAARALRGRRGDRGGASSPRPRELLEEMGFAHPGALPGRCPTRSRRSRAPATSTPRRALLERLERQADAVGERLGGGRGRARAAASSCSPRASRRRAPRRSETPPSGFDAARLTGPTRRARVLARGPRAAARRPADGRGGRARRRARPLRRHGRRRSGRRGRPRSSSAPRPAGRPAS